MVIKLLFGKRARETGRIFHQSAKSNFHGRMNSLFVSCYKWSLPLTIPLTGKIENIDVVSDAMCLAMVMDGAITGSDWDWAATVVQALFCTGCPKKKRNNNFFRLWTLFWYFGHVPKLSKRVQKEPKWSTQVFLTILEHFGPMWTLWTISNKNCFFAPKHLRQTLLFPFGAKNCEFRNGPKGSSWAIKAPKWSKTIGLTMVPFRPFWTTLERVQGIIKRVQSKKKYFCFFVGHPVLLHVLNFLVSKPYIWSPQGIKPHKNVYLPIFSNPFYFVMVRSGFCHLPIPLPPYVQESNHFGGEGVTRYYHTRAPSIGLSQRAMPWCVWPP